MVLGLHSSTSVVLYDAVSILLVMDDGLGARELKSLTKSTIVSILLVMDDGLGVVGGDLLGLHSSTRSQSFL